MIDLTFLLLGWPSYFLYLSLFSLTLEEYFASSVLANWRDREKALRFRRGQRFFAIIARTGFLLYGLSLWFLGVAQREGIICLAGLLFLTLTVLFTTLRKKYLAACLLALSLFLIYGLILLQFAPFAWF